MAPSGYRPCTGILLANADGEVFIGRRKGLPADAAYCWQMPQGGIDAGETPREAAFRELYEETSVRSAELIAEAPDWLAYDLPPEMLRSSWKNRWRGQTQKWVAFRFTGDEGEIDIVRPGGGRHKAEFEAWRWAPLESLPALVVPFKRGVYEKVVTIFRPLLGGSRG